MILGIGSAHIDILAIAEGDPDTKDRTGRIDFDIGGTGGNVAVNCAGMEAPTRFLTALNGSAHSKIIAEHLERSGVEAFIHEDRALRMAAFLATLDANGEMISATSCMPVESVVFPEKLIADAFDGAQAVFADCNLSAQSVSLFAAEAEKRGLPFYLAGVSEEKALRAADALRSGSKCACLFINRREAEYLKRRGMGKSSAKSAASKSETMEDMELAAWLGCPISITEGAAGALLVRGSGIDRIEAAPLGAHGSFLGAGDAFMAGAIVLATCDKLPLADALKAAAWPAADVAQRENCSMAEARAIERAIDFFHEKAHKDGLTGLNNRATTESFGFKALEKCLKTRKPFSAIILDIDHFKRVNDQCGHDVGDEVIKAVARIVKAALRTSDLSGRWGGEEFVCVLPGAAMEAAHQVAERIRSIVKETVNEPWDISISLGVAQAVDGENFSAVLKRADEALYASKTGGRNRVSCAPSPEPAGEISPPAVE